MGSKILKNDSINFKQLEAELTQAVAGDEKYQRENDAKFRAVRQKVASYDEFRDIVLASHLKSLDKADKSGGTTYQRWNTMASHDKNTSISSTNGECGKDPRKGRDWTVPKTSAEFEKAWKRSCRTFEDKFEFLVFISPTKLGEILKTECPLGEIICALNNGAELPQNFAFVSDVLEVLSMTKRFKLSVGFLETKEYEDLSTLLRKCDEYSNDESIPEASRTKYKDTRTKYTL